MVCPPLIITAEQVGELIATLRDSLDALASELKLPTGVQSGAAG
jgi:adenosylmethionine-8-amino-7-oxononanoate aminotransferase